MQYDEIFVEVRQRVASFQYWKEYWGNDKLTSYGEVSQDEYLDDAYRFLYTSASKEFMEFCAKKEGMLLGQYCDMLGIKESDLLG